MNTNVLKRFAQEARKKLLDQVGSKLEYVLNTESAELLEKKEQIGNLREAISKTSKEQLIDKVTYTWFNRFIALRFMDANDYQPIGIRVLTPKDGYTLPELLDEAKNGNIPPEVKVKTQRIFDILDGKIPSSNPQNEAFKELLIGACNHLNQAFPFLFERINDYTELLLPDDLTSELSIIQDIRDGMSIDDCAEVEIIGWLYQFYISEKKDEVFASKTVVKKEDIPAATQLFTPRWIVEYMVQNTVGKLWLQNKPDSTLRKHMPYFIESPSITAQDYLTVNSVEDITLLDQACGSGHILIYGFELLYKIYEEEGYNPNEIPELILTKNLYGFEIDERASQLAGIALMMKARTYNRRFFRKQVKPNILCYKDLLLPEDEIKNAFQIIGIKPSEELNHDLVIMKQATNFGSLITPHTQLNELEKVLSSILTKENISDAFLKYNLEQIRLSIEQLVHLRKKYHCIVDNPPYMGGGNMNKTLGDFLKIHYPSSKADLMACFMEAGLKMLEPRGFLGMINQHSWMFLTSYEKLREKLVDNIFFDTLLHMGPRTFPEIGGEVVQNTSFTFWNTRFEANGVYIRLVNFGSSDLKRKNTIKAILNESCEWLYNVDQRNFKKIDGSPISYWASENVLSSFTEYKSLGGYFQSDGPCKSGNDSKYLRNVWEISRQYYGINNDWRLCAKGGESRKGYGNLEYVLNWKKESQLHYRKDKIARITSNNSINKTGITWSIISGTNFSFRILPEDALFNSVSPAIFPLDDCKMSILQVISFLNSVVARYYLNLINPTLAVNVRDVLAIPINPGINRITDNDFQTEKDEWNTHETSVDFQKNELIRVKAQDLEETYDVFQAYWKNKFFQSRHNEEELNRQFLEIYGLQDELKPDVLLEDITILKDETTIENGQLVFHADVVFAQFISYAVGCMFGRYSLDKESLILDNQGGTLEDYLSKLGKSKGELKFIPDIDNIMPVLDDEWFEDDITGRFYTFLKASFGTANFEKNLAFIEECLGKDIRKYFVKDFYADHIKRYKKRPIYWMFSSPKGSFNILIYMHRYTPDTLNKILNSYLIEYREKLNNRVEHLDHLIVSGTSIEQTKAQKEKDKLKVVLIELQEYEREILRPLALERINIDLDDGVLINYNKFGKAIKEVAGLNDKATKKKIREFDWINVEEIR